MSDQTPEADDPLIRAADPVEAARQHVVVSALTESRGGRVGLELELHLVDHADPMRRPSWAEVQDIAAGLPLMPAASSITLEPGGQIELSTPPAADVVAAVADLRADEAALRVALGERGFGAAALGTDPARPVQRVNPRERYLAMEQHFDAVGCAGAGQQMMSATAALQINLDAGPATGWEARLGLVRSMVPMLVAASSTSPYLAGSTSGWHSMRQGIWQGIDPCRSDPVSQGEPTAAWAFYALNAPLMLLHDGDALHSVTERVPFAAWLTGSSPFDRRPTTADLDYHLTTLFPPVRPRGYVEIRCLDALPARWWPALAALTATLVDDPLAADEAAAVCVPVAEAWHAAARDGMADSAVRTAVEGCLEIAARRCPAELKSEVESLADLVMSGRTPSSELRARIQNDGPLRVLEEESHV